MKLYVFPFGFLFLGASLLGACGNGGGDIGSGASCKTAGDCESGEVCVTVGSESACTLNCSASVDACGGTASCEGVGSVGVSVCQEKKSSSNDPPSPKTQPKLACATDKDCSAIHSGTVCGEWMGEHDCTIACSSDDVCNPPPAGGFATHFLSCQQDQGDQSRKVCLPREECFQDPTSCVDFPGSGTGGGFPSGF